MKPSTFNVAAAEEELSNGLEKMTAGLDGFSDILEFYAVDHDKDDERSQILFSVAGVAQLFAHLSAHLEDVYRRLRAARGSASKSSRSASKPKKATKSARPSKGGAR